MFKCDTSFTRSDNLTRHVRSKHSEMCLKCIYCEKCFENAFKLQGHINKSHKEKKLLKRVSADVAGPSSKKVKFDATSENIFCEACLISVLKVNFHRHVRTNEHDDNSVEIIDKAFKSRVIAYKIKNSAQISSSEEFFINNRDKVIELIEKQLKEHTALKINFELFALYVKYDKSAEANQTDIKSFNTKNIVVASSSDIDAIYQSFASDIIKKSEEFQKRDSGWALQEVLYLELNINKYKPLRGSSYINLPKDIISKKACINIQNKDNACFAWAVMSALYPPDESMKPARISSYPHYSKVLQLDGIKFPMKL